MAAITAALGVRSAGKGAVKVKRARDTMKEAEKRNQNNMDRLEENQKRAVEIMDRLGKREMEIQSTFEDFAEAAGKIQNRPDMREISLGDVKIPRYEMEDLKRVSVGASVLLGGLGGAAAGTAGGFAAAGAATSAVVALGTASTGVPILSLSGAAATNATLAALGGGAIAAGGGGMALGTTILGASTLGVGLLVGGFVFQLAGSRMVEKADKAYAQMLEIERNADKVSYYLQSLSNTGKMFLRYFNGAAEIYERHLRKLKLLVYDAGKTNWNRLDSGEKLLVQNTVLLTGLLYRMCKVNLVVKNESENAINKVNKMEAERAIEDAKMVIAKVSKA